VVNLVQCGLMNLTITSFARLAEQVMPWEVATLAGPKSRSDAQRAYTRWGSQAGYRVVAGQKVPQKRPRVRDVRQREAPQGSDAMLPRASPMEDSIWNKIMHGLTTRRYSRVVRVQQAYGIEKSTGSDHFIRVSHRSMQKTLVDRERHRGSRPWGSIRLGDSDILLGREEGHEANSVSCDYLNCGRPGRSGQ
jgi:hypothetical protein